MQIRNPSLHLWIFAKASSLFFKKIKPGLCYIGLELLGIKLSIDRKISP